jgi:RNA polymerase sigma-70 factor (ECF subfamily)
VRRHSVVPVASVEDLLQRGHTTGAPALTLRVHEHPTVEETDIIAAAVAGRSDSCAWIVEQYTPVAYRFALRMFGNEQDARDAAQDTMVKVLRNLDRYDPRWRFTTWMFSIARNTCIDEHRRRRWRSDSPAPDVADDRPSAYEITARGRKAEVLHEALQDIPPLYREVLVLYHFEHLKYQEIADSLGIPIGTVMNRIFRARKKLRDAYERLEGAGGSP